MIRRPPRSTLFPYTNALPISSFSTSHSSRAHMATICCASTSKGLRGTTVVSMRPLSIPSTTAADSSRSPRNFGRSEEHTSELQSQSNLVCRLLLEKKKTERRLPRGDSANSTGWAHRPSQRDFHASELLDAVCLGRASPTALLSLHEAVRGLVCPQS